MHVDNGHLKCLIPMEVSISHYILIYFFLSYHVSKKDMNHFFSVKALSFPKALSYTPHGTYLITKVSFNMSWDTMEIVTK